VFLPVYSEGALVSVGDGHFAQGDGESCGTAIEIRARMRLRFQVHRGAGGGGALPWPMFLTSGIPRPAPGRSIGVLGLPVEAGVNYNRDLTLSTRQALISLVGLLSRAGYSREQAYVLASVAADLHVSQVVDLPNAGVSAILPLDIFLDGGERVLSALRGS
jgi:formamidase